MKDAQERETGRSTNSQPSASTTNIVALISETEENATDKELNSVWQLGRATHNASFGLTHGKFEDKIILTLIPIARFGS